MALRSDRLDAIVNLSKRRGFVYPSSEIYGGLRAAWDYGPLGVELKNNVKSQWWRYMIQKHGHVPAGGLDDINCPNGGVRGQFTEPRNFNGMLRTYIGPVEDENGLA